MTSSNSTNNSQKSIKNDDGKIPQKLLTFPSLLGEDGKLHLNIKENSIKENNKECVNGNNKECITENNKECVNDEKFSPDTLSLTKSLPKIISFEDLYNKTKMSLEDIKNNIIKTDKKGDEKNTSINSGSNANVNVNTDEKKISSYATTFTDNRLWCGISGIIGVGKTPLTTKLAKLFNVSAEYEPVKENIYLEDFYKNMSKYAFPMQIFLLNKRFQQHQNIVWSNKSAFQDRTIYEDVIFAKMLAESKIMDERDFTTYKETFQNMNNFLHRPDMIIYLDCEPEIAFERIKLRGRGCETTVSLSYLKDLKKGYEDWLENVISKKVPVLRIDYNKIPNDEEVVKIFIDFVEKNGLVRKIYI
jgi:deoxyadenosine kinase